MTIPLNGAPDYKAFAAAFREDIAKQMGTYADLIPYFKAYRNGDISRHEIEAAIWKWQCQGARI